MPGPSPIEWTDATWNPIVGCQVVSPGCTNCYAMRMAGTRLDHTPLYRGLTQASKAGPVWTGIWRENPAALTQPLRWKKPRRIFVNSMSDLFGEGVTDAMIDKVFAVMAISSKHTYQVLTKRSARMRSYFAAEDLLDRIEAALADLAEALPKGSRQRVRLGDIVECDAYAWARNTRDGYNAWPPKNLWLGVSAEDQARADERIPDLMATPAAVRFVSYEPAIGPIDFTCIPTMRFRGAEMLDALTGELSGMFGDPVARRLPALDWVIAGGESGPHARPSHQDWFRAVRDQCRRNGVAFFFKQWGEWAPIDEDDGGPIPSYCIGKKAAGRRLDGRTHDALPEVNGVP